ncbi:uncharacterized protein KGF55_002429 [Candida pseudojiufengensis]|uniref:uncharacterized protein n=1 Tax=Candida pseudojiufengensis TaxID=497109 RepID=UPI002224E597|nr:uncharacterized protein KGF55_002429 [Candida pseudojiufengensis]KAI5963549.1 hypothetical protein KGF55_002429 [Candida pseudojiufengensis]
MSEIILIDSDSENEIQPHKKFKPNPINESKIPNNLLTKPFKEVSSSSESEEEEENEALNNSNSNLNYNHTNTNTIYHQDSDSDSDSNSSRSQTPSDDDDDDEFEYTDLINAINPNDIEPTRKFLREHGSMEFLQTYLPSITSCKDIINLILQLGFIPKNLKQLIKKSTLLNENNLSEYVTILHQAMMKIKSIRERKEDVKTYKDVIELIKKSSKILVITGAGISTSLGIPDFRSSKGFYSMIESLGLNDPQEVFDLDLFKLDPSLFYSIADKILPPGKNFSPLHSFIYLLQKKGKLLRNYTQNIDNLESYAGIKTEKLIQCHGSFANATCLTCKDKVEGEKIFPQIKLKQIPYCLKCKIKKQQLQKKNDELEFSESFGVYKPDITFFGESLPERFHDFINKDLNDCDLLISIGTSLKVAPVADIVEKIPQSIPQILINKDPINHCQFDVSLLGFCDDIASFLCNELGNDWDLPHKDYDSIRGPKGEYLNIELKNEELREYHIESINRKAKSEEVDSGLNGIQKDDIEINEIEELRSLPLDLISEVKSIE